MDNAHDVSILDLVPHHCSQKSLEILDLPPEIILHILRYHFQGLAINDSKKRMNHYAPIHTCSTFRRIALDDRHCWSTIGINIDFPEMLLCIPQVTDNPELGDYRPAVTRLLSEAEWRLERVRDLPIDLRVRFYTRLESHEAFVYVQVPAVVEMVQKFMRETFGPNGMGPRISSYEEDGYRLYGQSPYSLFKDVVSVMNPHRYEKTLTSLQLKCARLEDQLTFPNLTNLAVWGYGDSFAALSKIIAPALETIHVREFGTGEIERRGVLRLAPLIARFPKLHSADLSGTLYTCLFPPQGEEQKGYWQKHQHPFVTALTIFTDEVEQSAPPRWKFSTFLKAFPNLQTVMVDTAMGTAIDPWTAEDVGGFGYMDEIGKVRRLNNVSELIFARAQNVDAMLIRISMEMFPNLKKFILGPTNSMGLGGSGPDSLIHGGKVFELLAEYFAPDFDALQGSWSRRRQ
jgi:hypothetical protein